MKRLAIALLLGGILLAQTSKQPKQPPNPAPTSNNSREENGPRDSGGQAVVKQIVVNQPVADSDKQKAKDNGWYSNLINSIFTGIIALFTFLTWKVYREILRASKINERAWIVGNTSATLPGGPVHAVHQSFPILFTLENKGRTPAWLTASGSRAFVVSPNQPLSPTPEYDWAKPFPIEGTLVPPKGHVQQGFNINGANLSKINSGVGTLHVFGVAKYRDIYGDKHETRYCFVFHRMPTAENPAPRGFYIGGPEGYNSAS